MLLTASLAFNIPASVKFSNSFSSLCPINFSCHFLVVSSSFLLYQIAFFKQFIQLE